MRKESQQEWVCPICGCRHLIPGAYSLNPKEADELQCKRCGQYIKLRTELKPKDILIVSVSGGLVQDIFTNLNPNDIDLRLMDFDTLKEGEENESEEDIEKDLRDAERLLELAGTDLHRLY